MSGRLARAVEHLALAVEKVAQVLIDIPPEEPDTSVLIARAAHTHAPELDERIAEVVAREMQRERVSGAMDNASLSRAEVADTVRALELRVGDVEARVGPDGPVGAALAHLGGEVVTLTRSVEEMRTSAHVHLDARPQATSTPAGEG